MKLWLSKQLNRITDSLFHRALASICFVVGMGAVGLSFYYLNKGHWCVAIFLWFMVITYFALGINGLRIGNMWAARERKD